MTKRGVSNALILVPTAIAILLEFVAGLDRNPNTVPWTELIAGYVPQEITVTAIAVLTAWLPKHFADAYARRGPRPPLSGYRKLIVAALAAGGVAMQAAVTDNQITPDEWQIILGSALGAIGVWGLRNNAQRKPPEAVQHLREQQARRTGTPIPPGSVPPRM